MCPNGCLLNYDPMANTDDGSCSFPVDEFGVDNVDCTGACLNDADEDGGLR